MPPRHESNTMPTLQNYNFNTYPNAYESNDCSWYELYYMAKRLYATAIACSPSGKSKRALPIRDTLHPDPKPICYSEFMIVYNSRTGNYFYTPINPYTKQPTMRVLVFDDKGQLALSSSVLGALSSRRRRNMKFMAWAYNLSIHREQGNDPCPHGYMDIRYGSVERPNIQFFKDCQERRFQIYENKSKLYEERGKYWMWENSSGDVKIDMLLNKLDQAGITVSAVDEYLGWEGSEKPIEITLEDIEGSVFPNEVPPGVAD